MRINLLLASLLSLAMPPVVLAGQIADLAKQAEDEIGKAEGGPAAHEKMRAALAAAQAKIPFDIRKAFFVSEKPLMFGAYQRVKANEFPVGATLISYVEPIGLAWKSTDDARVQARFTVDFELRSPEGEMLAEQKAFGNFSITAVEPLFEIFTPLTLDVSQAPAGAYVLKYTFTDLTSDNKTDVEQRFTLK
ncbi:hypothetical protein M2360_004206 [Rhizobium sp. SG_E_25_P2]|uniref:hypothetical protein n=1 Tax=Rhizobium sp. SG_E_25_P2 TaxID=2879942 RepID=UPI0024755127|nr:hypothetical protein [Rhizobium sp. SG_E_25_P2]MDH6268788.1 hypothetical protein [Rhizobium sp. SG_E_25_P2]